MPEEGAPWRVLRGSGGVGSAPSVYGAGRHTQLFQEVVEHPVWITVERRVRERYEERHATITGLLETTRVRSVICRATAPTFQDGFKLFRSEKPNSHALLRTNDELALKSACRDMRRHNGRFGRTDTVQKLFEGHQWPDIHFDAVVQA